ncbi:MAG: PAS domain-containing protein [Anaerolinea sp.]|nr:PAS domain-containing protein [Anaerolinea sp.]
MTMPPLDIESLMLASHVAKVFSLIHHVAYALIAPEMVVLRASSNFAAVLNEPDKTIVGRPLTDLLWEFVGAEGSLQAVLQGKMPYLAFERVNRELPDGRILYLDLSVTHLRDTELGDGLLLIVEDVTHAAELEQRVTQNRNELSLAKQQLMQANEELQKLNRLKSLFLSMAVHDLRMPLTAIRAYGDLLLRVLPVESPEKVREYAHIIASQTNRLDWLIDDFLDLDKIEHGDLKLHLVLADFNKLAGSVAEMLRYVAERRKHVWRLQLWDEPIFLKVDANRMQQVFYNLFSNAMKYTPVEGHIDIKTWVEDSQAVLQISDMGMGMTAEEQANVFQLYYRATDASDLETRGGGLGLFIAKVLVEAHHGYITLVSQPGEGSTFTIYLPLDAPVDGD